MRIFSISRLSLSTLHWAILPNLSESDNCVVATIGVVSDVELSSDAEDSPPGEPARFFVLRSFLILVNSTYKLANILTKSYQFVM